MCLFVCVCVCRSVYLEFNNKYTQDVPGLEGTGLRSGRGFARDEKVLYILTLGVMPRFQNRGIAKRLVRTLLDENAASHATTALHTMVSNTKAIHFYHKLGFETVMKIDRFYTLKDGSRHAALLLAKNLSREGRSSTWASSSASASATSETAITIHANHVSDESESCSSVNFAFVMASLRVWFRSVVGSAAMAPWQGPRGCKN